MPFDLRNIEHDRAEYAFQRIRNIKDEGDEEKERKYRSAVRSAGALILKSGLMQTLAFYLSKEKDYGPLAEDILKWREVREGNPYDKPLKIYGGILDLDDELIIYKTQAAISLIVWLKRFAEGMLKGEDDA